MRSTIAFYKETGVSGKVLGMKSRVRSANTLQNITKGGFQLTFHLVSVVTGIATGLEQARK